MANSILLICGHWNIENMTTKGLRKWRSAVALRKSTGASGERDWLWNVLRPRLTEKLIAKGIQVFITDAIYNEDIYSRDYGLAIALHYDASNENSRCMSAKPRPTIDPPFISADASAKSDKFISDWLSIYPSKTGITSNQGAVTEGMTDYYAWDYVGTNTPSVIIEHGNNTCPSDHDKMFNNPDLIAEADVEAVVKYFGLELEMPSIPTTEPQNNINERVTAVELNLDKVNDELAKNTRRLDEIQRSVDVVSADRDILEDLQGKMVELKEIVKTNSDVLQANKKELRDEIRTNTELSEQNTKELESRIEAIEKGVSFNKDKFEFIKKLFGKYFIIKLK